MEIWCCREVRGNRRIRRGVPAAQSDRWIKAGHLLRGRGVRDLHLRALPTCQTSGQASDSSLGVVRHVWVAWRGGLILLMVMMGAIGSIAQ